MEPSNFTIPNPCNSNSSTARHVGPHITYLAKLVTLHPRCKDVILEAAKTVFQAFHPIQKITIDGDYFVVRGGGHGRRKGWIRVSVVNGIVSILVQIEGENVIKDTGTFNSKSQDSNLHSIKIIRDNNLDEKRVERSTPLLHDEIIFTILSRLPAIYLNGIMRYVCNTWERIIRNPCFVETHLERLKPGLFLQNYSSRRASFIEFKENKDFEITYFNRSYPGVLESTCEGMSIFRNCMFLYVANPVIMDVVKFPLGSYGDRNCIARLPSKGGFKLVRAHAEEHGRTSWHVLTLGIDDSWRNLGSVVSTSLYKSMNPISIGQFIYWTPTNVRFREPYDIVITDIAEESVSRVSFTTETYWLPQFVKIGNRLSCIQTSVFGCKIYVSKDLYLGGWEIYHRIVADSMEMEPFYLDAMFFACVEDELIFESRKQYFAYNMTTKGVRSLDGLIDGRKDFVTLHTNSLVSWSNF